MLDLERQSKRDHPYAIKVNNASKRSGDQQKH
jgi:hypothetical protein